VELSLRGIVRSFGLKLGKVQGNRISELGEE
jgi:hypothetical protein